MMIDPEDKRTRELELSEHRENTSKNNVVSITELRLEDRAIELGLVRERRPVFVFDASEARKRGGSAERMAKMRAKQTEAGLRSATVPAALLEEVKKAGSWEKWQAEKAAAFAPALVAPEPKILEVEKRVDVPGPERIIEIEKIVEKIVEKPVPVELGRRDKESIRLGRAVQNLTGWRKALAFFVLGAAISEK